jgi:hypothetical protein
MALSRSYDKPFKDKRDSEKFLNHTFTIWFASYYSKPKDNSNLIPLGWAVMEVVG